MDAGKARFVAVFLLSLCIFSANNSEGNRKLAESFSENGDSSNFRTFDEDMVEQVWLYCRKELKLVTEVFKDLDLDKKHHTTLLVKKSIQEAISNLPPKGKQIILECLSHRSSPWNASSKDVHSATLYQELHTDWNTFPRRYLRGNEASTPNLSPSSSPDSAPTPTLTLSPHTPASTPSPMTNDTPEEAPEPSPEPPPLPHPRPKSSPTTTPQPPPPPPAEKHSPSKPNVVTPTPSGGETNEERKLIIGIVIASCLAGAFFLAFLLVCYIRNTTDEFEPQDDQKDDKHVHNLASSKIPTGSSQKCDAIAKNPSSKDFKPLSISDGISDANSHDDHVKSSLQANEEACEKNVSNLPLPPGKKAAPTPPPPKPPAPAPPPPPRGARPPPNPPPKRGNLPKPSPLGANNTKGEASESSAESEAAKPKLKPFFWDKVLANPDHSMVWHEIKEGSFQFDEEMMESLFGYIPANKNKNEHKRDSSSNSPQLIKIIDAKKAQNLAILLKALNVSTQEVCDAVKEGNELPQELVRTLLKMAPTADEELKLRLYSGDLSFIGPAERFLKVMVEIPFAFKRLEAILFMSTLQEEVSTLKESLATLEVACTELRNSRLFLKLLEAVLKTGNRMNDGTYRGGAQAFKLDTLLKLADVKGTDGKTTLLYFVVLEIIRSEGVRAARKLRESQSMSSVKTDDLNEDSSQDLEEYHLNLGLQVVSSVSSELENVRKASLIESDSLGATVTKLGHALVKTRTFLETEMKDVDEDSEFYDTLSEFIQLYENDITFLSQEEKRIMDLVMNTGDYFYGNAGKGESLHLFVIVRDFLVMLEKVCREVKSTIKVSATGKTPMKEASSSTVSPSQESRQESLPDFRRRLFPAIEERHNEDDSSDSSSDDES